MNERSVKIFSFIYNWFKNNLSIVFPDSKYFNLLFEIENKENFSNYLQQIIRILDTGISRIDLRTLNISEIDKNLPKELLKDIEKDIIKNNNSLVMINDDNLFLFSQDEEKIKIKKLITYHRICETNQEISFEIEEESDGTRRLFDLLPGLISILKEDGVFIVDEIDRSLHPILCKKTN